LTSGNTPSPFFYGPGATGKSTLLEIVRCVKGDYACMAKRNEQHPTEIADFLSERLVVKIRTQEGRRFNESLFRWLSGRDRLKGPLHETGLFRVLGDAQTHLVANHKLIVRDAAESFWRRLKVDPVQRANPAREAKQRLARGSERRGQRYPRRDGQAALKWRKHGLPEPQEITTVTRRLPRGAGLPRASFLLEALRVRQQQGRRSAGRQSLRTVHRVALIPAFLRS
jgi:putative DNA primase/helicase